MFKFRCDIIFTGRTAVTKTPTSLQASSNEMRLVTQCGGNYQQGERNHKVTYKPTILKLLTPCILINFFPFTKPTKCTYNMHNSTVSLQVWTTNEHAVQCIHSWCTLGVPKQRIIRFSSAPQMFRYGTLLSVTFEINSNKILTIYLILTTYIVIIVTVFLLHYICIWGTRSLAVGCGTALQTGRSRVPFPIVALDFSRT
jgi:hypothetical protein